jgi:UDP-2,3-diacylglucosamine pyrophosphatase LpxH
MIQAKKIIIDTLIISDIHLGDGLTRTREILEVLNKYTCKKLILNGDILNGLRFKRFHAGHWEILSKFRKLSKSCEVIWIHGNHDAASSILSRLLGITVRNRYVWNSAGKKFLAIHGHQFDRFLNDNIIISHVAFYIYGWLKRFSPEGYLIKLIKRRSQTWKRNSFEVAKGALRLGRLLRVNYVFCGHTHIIDRAEESDIKYFNTGTWVEKPSAYLTITDAEVKLIQVD